MTTSEMSPADFAAVTNNNGNGNCNGWGGGWEVWIFAFILMAMCGWGGFGFGGGYGGGFGGGAMQGYATQADIQRGFDTSAIVTKLDGISNGICDSTYALTNAVNNGFASAELSRCNGQAALMQQLNNMAMNDQKCCCETQRLIERGFCDTNYNLATQACEIKNTVQNSTRDIIDNNNNNARMLYDFLVQSKIDAKDEKIAEQQSQIQALNLAASQANQNAALRAIMDANTAEIIRRTGHDIPVPSYPVPNPNCCYGNYGYPYGNNCNNTCNSGCSGCGC